MSCNYRGVEILALLLFFCKIFKLADNVADFGFDFIIGVDFIADIDFVIDIDN